MKHTTEINRNVSLESQRHWAASEAVDQFDKAANHCVNAARAAHAALTPIAGNNPTKRKYLDEITVRASALMREMSEINKLAGMIAGNAVVPQKRPGFLSRIFRGNA